MKKVSAQSRASLYRRARYELPGRSPDHSGGLMVKEKTPSNISALIVSYAPRALSRPLFMLLVPKVAGLRWRSWKRRAIADAFLRKEQNAKRAPKV
jgi:hypothetical protein